MDDAGADAAETAHDSAAPASSSRPRASRGVLRWVWRGIAGLFFGRRNVDFEQRLKHLSKEEVAVHARMKRRAYTWRRLARAIVLYSVVIELLVLGFAILSTRSPGLPWNLRALRVLPVFAVPALAAFAYTSCARYYQMRDRKDQRTLEQLRAERQARIDELKQRTNYYATQELIQRYDLDPTAKAAAASVLAAKLGAESGLNLAFKAAAEGSDSSNEAANQGKSRSPVGVSSSGIRNRKTPQGRVRESSDDSGFMKALVEEVHGENERETLERDAALDRARGRVGGAAGAAGAAGAGGWMARVAAMLVGEDPSQCYALICRHCHMHNGLAPKEDFRYIMYICPHCHTLNGNRQLREGGDGGESSKRGDMPSEHEGSPALNHQPPVSSSAPLGNDGSSSEFTTHTAESDIADS